MDAQALDLQYVATILDSAIGRVEMANAEGDPILSAWLPNARAIVAQLRQHRSVPVPEILAAEGQQAGEA